MTPGFDERMHAFRQQMAQVIDRHGWMVQGVFPTVDQPSVVPFAYTVGMTGRGLPELLMSGLPLEYLHGWLNAVGALHTEAAPPFADGDVIESPDKKPLRVVEAVDAPAGMAKMFYRSRGHAGPIRVLQLVWPDADGRWPTDPGWAGPRQELFGPLFLRPEG